MAIHRPEIRARRSAPDAGEGKLLVKGEVADSFLLRETTGRLYLLACAHFIRPSKTEL